MFSVAEVRALASQYYHLDAQVKQLPGELDFNFQLTAKDGKKYTLKIANRKEKEVNLDLQNKLIIHLGSKGTKLEVPRVIPSSNGKEIEVIKDPDGYDRFMRLLTWIDGRPLALVNPHTPELLGNLGAMCGQLSRCLSDFDHPAAHRFMKWDPSQAEWVKDHLQMFAGERKVMSEYFYNLFESFAQPLFPQLRQSVNYSDANDYNVLVSEEPLSTVVPGVIDFGDATYSHTVNELAIAIAYGIMHKPDPLTAACDIVKGYHREFELTEIELQALFPLTCTRLLISVTCSAININEEPDNVYLQISDKPAWDLLAKLHSISPSLAYYRFREACGFEPCPQRSKFDQWVTSTSFSNLVKGLNNSQPKYLDLSVGSAEIGNWENIGDAEKLHRQIARLMEDNGATVAIGQYDEVRPIYTSDAFQMEGNHGPAWRTVHLGVDVFAKEGTEVFTPLEGEVFGVADNEGDRNYGPTVILRHQVSDELTFYTLYGHLSRTSIREIKTGQRLKGGELVGTIGAIHENGHWSPHLHFQIILDLLGNETDFPGVADPSQKSTWLSVCPDPQTMLGLKQPTQASRTKEEILAYRKRHLGKNLSVSYKRPLKMLRGMGQYLLDDTGRRYLDTVNNVAHVGHEHPRVVKVGQKQMAVLNTNTRYLHDNIIRFTESLLSTMPGELSVAYIVNSGSEANELALRLARNHTQSKETVVLEVGYHGNTTGCVEISSYKFDGPGGKGALPHIHVVPMPDTYRGRHKADDPEAGKKYAHCVKEAIERIQRSGGRVSSFVCESVLSCGGQIPLPKDYLKDAYRYTREGGGVCIADEVQTGCGRAGDHFWTFEQHGVVPDIVTIGKPIGNGHPLGVVVTTQAIADSFYNGMEYFNTFGGNPVSCAIGSEVLAVIKEEGLQQNAFEVGAYLTEKLTDMKSSHACIGDVRGPGLFIGIELVDDELLKPATEKATYLANRMRELGVLMSTDGPFNNVLKIKPPVVFSRRDADFLVSTLDRVFKEDFMKKLSRRLCL